MEFLPQIQNRSIIVYNIQPPPSWLPRLCCLEDIKIVLPPRTKSLPISKESPGSYLTIHETMPFFKITLIRSSIGLPKKTQGVLNALGLRKRMATVFKPVNPSTAGQIMRIKELVAVSEVETALSDAEMREMRRPDPGYYIETPAAG